ncbi:MAG: hypothetical protein P8L83_04510 [Flavobacteriaceae bacterium]|nr:hypothetical protein [Flavobacteriaceae bacterium]
MKRQPNKWLVFSGLAFQIAIIMYLMAQLGNWIELKTSNEEKLPTLLCLIFGLITIIYLVKKQSKNL